MTNPPGGESSLKVWNGVPDRSVLEIDVKGDKGFTANARIVSDDQRILTLNDSQLHPGPTRTLLSQTAQGYTCNIFVTFDLANQVNATIHARIEDPSGNVFKAEKTYPVSGKQGDDPQNLTLFISMVPA